MIKIGTYALWADRDQWKRVRFERHTDDIITIVRIDVNMITGGFDQTTWQLMQTAPNLWRSSRDGGHQTIKAICAITCRGMKLTEQGLLAENPGSAAMP